MKWDREELFLLQCCRNRESLAERFSLPDIPPAIDWHLFLMAARKEGVSPILLRTFAHCKKGSAIPDWLILELKKDYYAVLAKNAVVFDELGKILAAMNQAGHKVMVLKGAFLAENVYKDRGLRPMADVDLLIRKEDLVVIDTVFRANGYSSDDFCAIDLDAVPEQYLTSVVYHSPSVYYFCFHIHWHIVNSSVPNQELIAHFSMDDIWKHADSVVLAGQATLVMAPYHLLIHLCEHGLRVTHSLSKLSFLYDIYAVVASYGEDFDWDTLVEKSRDYKIDRFVYQSLALAAKLMGCPVPPDVLTRLRPARLRFGERLFPFFVLHNFRISGLSFLLYLSNKEGLLKKAAFIFRIVFPPRQVMAQRWAVPVDSTGSFLYLKRVGEIMRTFYAMIRKVVGQAL